MTRIQAQRLMDDIGSSLTDDDYIDDIYLSINGIGTKTFRSCAYHQADGYTFIWTKTEKYLISKKEIGNHVIIPRDASSQIILKKVI